MLIYAFADLSTHTYILIKYKMNRFSRPYGQCRCALIKSAGGWFMTFILFACRFEQKPYKAKESANSDN